jgi:hypothetical protein
MFCPSFDQGGERLLVNVPGMPNGDQSQLLVDGDHQHEFSMRLLEVRKLIGP